MSSRTAVYIFPHIVGACALQPGVVPSAGTAHSSQYIKPGLAYGFSMLAFHPRRWDARVEHLPSQPHSFRLCTVRIALVVVFLRKTISVFTPWLLLFITSSITDHSYSTSECSLDTVSCCVCSSSPLLETLTEASSPGICGVEREGWSVQTVILCFNKCQLVFCSFPFLVYYIPLTWEPKAHACNNVSNFKHL